MEFSIERPWALYGILILIPVSIYCVVVYKKTLSALSASYAKNDSFNLSNVKKRIVFRILFRSIAWCMLIFAYSGISWGTISTPVQKNGNAISFVFDISYSMTSRDAPFGHSRLEAAAQYAGTILQHIEEGTPVSAVLVKGSGVLAIPLTEDSSAISTLLETISPAMLSSAGSNLGEGIVAALKSFPHTVSRKQVIWLFTDGEETSSSLLNALNVALRQGVSVVIIGFGSEREIEITAGDGETKVKTALRSEQIKQAVDSANKKNFGEQGFKFFKGASAKYVEAAQMGSAVAVLSSIKKASDENFSLAYEVRSVKRHVFFIFMAIVFFALSFVVAECRSVRTLFSAVSLIAILSFTSCSSEFRESKKILEATWAWYQKDYNQAVADFSQSLSSAKENGDDLIEQYALYGLSSTYLMQNENAAALEKIASLSDDTPNQIRFAAFYNSGIIAGQNGDYEKAAELFKQALLVDSTNINAKINLEVSQSQRAQQTSRQGEQNLSGAEENVSQDSLLEKSIFNRIRENEKTQWKNLQSEQKTSALDY